MIDDKVTISNYDNVTISKLWYWKMLEFKFLTEESFRFSYAKVAKFVLSKDLWLVTDHKLKEVNL